MWDIYKSIIYLLIIKINGYLLAIGDLSAKAYYRDLRWDSNYLPRGRNSAL